MSGRETTPYHDLETPSLQPNAETTARKRRRVKPIHKTFQFGEHQRKEVRR